MKDDAVSKEKYAHPKFKESMQIFDLHASLWSKNHLSRLCFAALSVYKQLSLEYSPSLLFGIHSSFNWQDARLSREDCRFQF